MNGLLTILVLVASFFIISCQDDTEPEVNFWEPSTEQIETAEIIAQKYASTELKVPKDILDRVKYSAYGFYRKGNKVIYLEFFDPREFPNWKNMVGVLGGFPHYYTISVDFLKMKVVDSYASSE